MGRARLLKLRHTKPAILLLLGLLSLAVLSFDLFNLVYLNKIYPRTSIVGLDFSWLDYSNASTKLSEIKKPTKATFALGNQNFDLSLEDLGIKYDDTQTIKNALLTGRSNNILFDLREMVKGLAWGKNVPLSYSLDRDTFDKAVDNLTTKIEAKSQQPLIDIKNGQISVNPGKDGNILDKESLKSSLFKSIENASDSPVPLTTKTETAHLSDEQVENIRKVASGYLGKKMILKFEDQQFVYSDKEIIDLLNLYTGKPDDKKVEKLASDITKTVNRMPEDARFVFEDGKVKEFNPGKDGIQVDTQGLVEKVTESIIGFGGTAETEIAVTIPVSTSKPQVTTGDVNNMGIKELIGKGESAFRGSVPNRVYNITLASERLNGILIKPGEEFSFLKALGDVNVYTGFKQAYVIKDGKTVLGDGGGVCQVSSTFFRAALASGLPILERHQHSYRVSYYEQDSKLGLDATVFEPSVDLRIKNDTPGYILIQTKLDIPASRLTFEFYGTSDGRKSEISNFRSWDVKDPPPALYIDNPSLPTGTTKQTEHAIKGIKTAFDYKVIRDGEVLQDKSFYSNYRAWQAVYLRGTGGQ